MNDWPPQPGLTLMQSRLSARRRPRQSPAACRVERHARRHAGLADALQPVKVRGGLDVDGVRVGAGLGVVVDEALGLLDHHVHRQRAAGVVHLVRDAGRAGPNVITGTKCPSMTSRGTCGAGVEQLVDAGAEGPEVGGEDRGADLDLGQPGAAGSTPVQIPDRPRRGGAVPAGTDRAVRGVGLSRMRRGLAAAFLILVLAPAAEAAEATVTGPRDRVAPLADATYAEPAVKLADRVWANTGNAVVTVSSAALATKLQLRRPQCPRPRRRRGWQLRHRRG